MGGLYFPLLCYTRQGDGSNAVQEHPPSRARTDEALSERGEGCSKGVAWSYVLHGFSGFLRAVFEAAIIHLLVFCRH